MNVTVKGGAVRFEVHARPRAKRSQIEGIRDGRVDVALRAPPADGAANDELVRTLSEALGVPRRSISIVFGESSRKKLVEVEGLGESELRARISAAVPQV